MNPGPGQYRVDPFLLQPRRRQQVPDLPGRGRAVQVRVDRLGGGGVRRSGRLLRFGRGLRTAGGAGQEEQEEQGALDDSLQAHERMSFLSGVCLDDFLSIIAPKPGGGKRKYPDSRLVPPVGSVPTRVFEMGPAGPVGAATCRPSLRNLRIFLRMGIPLPVNTSAILRKWVVRKPVRCYHEHEKLNDAEKECFI